MLGDRRGGSLRWACAAALVSVSASSSSAGTASSPCNWLPGPARPVRGELGNVAPEIAERLSVAGIGPSEERFLAAVDRITPGLVAAKAA